MVNKLCEIISVNRYLNNIDFKIFLLLIFFISGTNKQRFDSRTYTRPKKKTVRPSLYSVVPNHSYTSNHYNTENLCGKSVGIHSRPHGDYLGITSKYMNEDITGTTDVSHIYFYLLTSI